MLLKIAAIIPCTVVAIIEFLCKLIAWIPISLLLIYILAFYPIAKKYKYKWGQKLYEFAKFNFKWTKNLWNKYE